MSTVEAEAYNKYDLEMVDSDLGSWEQGDKLVIASTDYDYQQAEEVVVDSVEGNIVHVTGNFTLKSNFASYMRWVREF